MNSVEDHEKAEFETMNQLLFERITTQQYAESEKILVKMKQEIPSHQEVFALLRRELVAPSRKNSGMRWLCMKNGKAFFGKNILVEVNLGIAYRGLKKYKGSRPISISGRRKCTKNVSVKIIH